MKVELYNLKNEKVGTAEVADAVFGVQWKPDLVYQALVVQRANARRPWAHAKSRGEVRGGGRKPWVQKGTGRARHGSIRSPIWRGGGKAHGPRKERDYTQKINKKMRRLAYCSTLSKKFSDGEVKFFDTLAVDSPKTSALATSLRTLLGMGARTKKFDVLLITPPNNTDTKRAATNLTKVKALDPRSLNVDDLLHFKYVFIDKESVDTIADHYEYAPA